MALYGSREIPLFINMGRTFIIEASLTMGHVDFCCEEVLKTAKNL